jgi:hypothetical protein
MHERRAAHVDKEIALLTRIIERDAILADVLTFLINLNHDNAEIRKHRDDLINRMTRITQ